MVKIGSGEDGNGGMAGFGRGLVSGLVVGAVGLTLLAALNPPPVPVSKDAAVIAEEPAGEMQAPEDNGPDMPGIQDKAGPDVEEAAPVSAGATDMDDDRTETGEEAPDQSDPSKAGMPPDLAAEDEVQDRPTEDDPASLADAAPSPPPAPDEPELPVMPFMAASTTEDAPKVPRAEILSPGGPADATAPRMPAWADPPQGPPSMPALPVETALPPPDSADELPVVEISSEDAAAIEPGSGPQSAITEHATDDAAMPDAADRVAEDAVIPAEAEGEAAPIVGVREDPALSPPADTEPQADFGRGGKALAPDQADDDASDKKTAPDPVGDGTALPSDHAGTPRADTDPARPASPDADAEAGQPLPAPPVAASTAGLEPAPAAGRGFPAPDLSIPPMLSELLSSSAEGSR